MNISGVLLHAFPENTEGVKQQLLEIPGVEVHAISDEGRLVVTVEEDDTGMMADTVMSLQNIPGVLSASMIYHHFEEDEDMALDAGASDQTVSNTESGTEEASK